MSAPEPPAPLGSTLRVLRPAPHVLAFYDGRLPGRRAYADRPNWLDDGAYTLGIASYAVIDGPHALVYDTHISLPHARLIRRHLENLGVRHLRVVLSHWHDDHVAGNEAFADVEILAHRLTAEILAERRPALEAGDPPIRPLVLPTATWDGPRHELAVGRLRVTLHPADIHSRDGVLLHLPECDLLLVGDTLEDPITYFAEPERLAIHLDGLRALETWAPPRLLPNHGCPDRLAAGGYAPSLIAASRRYVEKLLRCPQDPALAAQDLRTFIAADLAAGTLVEFAPYETVHRGNVAALLARPNP